VVNAARRGELYSKYTYYHSYYTPKEEDAGHGEETPVGEAPAELAEPASVSAVEDKHGDDSPLSA
jgi:hypothetical protein